MTLSFLLVVAALMPALAFSARCYLGVSSPDAINGIYAPFLYDAWRVIDDNGMYGPYVIKQSPEDKNDYYFFKDGVKILNKLDATYNATSQCIDDKDNVLDTYPKTYIFALPHPMSGPFLGEIHNPVKTKVNPYFDFYHDCFNWARKQKIPDYDDEVSGVNWNYNGTCIATWGGEPANKVTELGPKRDKIHQKNHMRAQLFHRVPAPGTSGERKFIGKAKNMKECVKLADEEGAAVMVVVFHKSGKCYYTGHWYYYMDTYSDDWTYFNINIAAKPFTLASYTCSTT